LLSQGQQTTSEHSIINAGTSFITMFDRRNHAKQFRVAVRNIGSSSNNGDSAQKLAILFRIAAVAATRLAEESKSSNETESCQGENGMDWTSVLNSWLDVCEAAEKVSNVGC
jgi:hypothetical protein